MMPMEKQTDSGNALLMFLLGAATGATCALLFAPASGSQTRRYLGERARDARSGASDAASKARDAMQQGRQAAVATFDDWRPAVNAVVDSGRQAIEQGRQAIEQGKQVISSAVAQGREAYQQAKTRDLPTT
jgi:gas vesicle protein